MFSSKNIFEPEQNYLYRSECNSDTTVLDTFEFKEITKASEKLKWINRFRDSYSGGVTKSLDLIGINQTKAFVASYQNKEVGYTRVIDMTESFIKFYGIKVSRIAETYVKPPYRKMGVCTALRRYVREYENAIFLRIEKERFLKKQKYFEKEGFFFAYNIMDSDLCIICTPEFFDPLTAYSLNRLNDRQ